MKTLILTSLVLFSLNSQATEVDVVSAEFGVEDQAQNKTLCLTVVRVPKNGKLLGVVEGIEDCFYARKGKKNPRLTLNLKSLKPIAETDLLQHLQTLDTQLKFYFSQGE